MFLVCLPGTSNAIRPISAAINQILLPEPRPAYESGPLRPNTGRCFTMPAARLEIELSAGARSLSGKSSAAIRDE